MQQDPEVPKGIVWSVLIFFMVVLGGVAAAIIYAIIKVVNHYF